MNIEFNTVNDVGRYQNDRLGAIDVVDLVGNIGSWFGSQTSAADFMADGDRKLAKIKTRFERDFKNNPSAAVTRLHSDLQFTYKESAVNLSNSSSTRSINGNRNSVEIFTRELKNFDALIAELRKDFDISYEQTSKSFKGSGEYFYNTYRLVRKSGVSQVGNTPTPVNTSLPQNTTTSQNSTGNNGSPEKKGDTKGFFSKENMPVILGVGGVVLAGTVGTAIYLNKNKTGAKSTKKTTKVKA